MNDNLLREQPTSAGIWTQNQLLFSIPVRPGFERVVEIAGDQIDPHILLARNVRSQSLSDYRDAAANLLVGKSGAGSRIFVTSPCHGDGKTCAAFNLAYSLAQSGRSVLLLELNFVKPRFCAVLGDLKVRFGVENALRDSAEPGDTVFSLVSSGLHIAAVRHATPIGRLQQILRNLNAFLDWGNENFDILVIDCPPVVSREWDKWFREYIGPALMIIRQDRTPMVEIKRAAKLLGVHLRGVLLNSSRRDSARLASPMASEKLSHVPVELTQLK